jgi:uncharacterized protein
MDEVRTQALDYLQAHQVMSLATVGAAGVWNAAVFYVNDGFDLFFLSAGHTRHARNMMTQPQVAATIQEDYKDWPQIQGIQLEGHVVELHDAARQVCIALYQIKYPFLAGNDPQIKTAVSKVNWYRLRPTRLYFIDNRKGLGHRDDVPLGGNME